LGSLDDEVIDVLIERGGAIASANSQLEVLSMGGAISRVPDADTAFAHRATMFPVNVCGIWKPNEDSTDNIAWVRGTYEALEPYLQAGSYLNFGGSDVRPQQASEGYGSNWRRLREVKTQYDPDNFFSANANILPLPVNEVNS
jgi:hypothetical protein